MYILIISNNVDKITFYKKYSVLFLIYSFGETYEIEKIINR